MVDKAKMKKVMRQFTPKRTNIAAVDSKPLELPNFNKGKAPESERDLVNKKYVDDAALGGGDNLGNHVATQTISGADVSMSGDITAINITGTNLYGDGSNITNIGAAAASALTIVGKAAENIAMGEAVYISGSAGSNTQFSLADNTVHGKGDCIGLAAETKTTGQTILIRHTGELINWDTTGGGGWSDGDKLYLSTGGALVNAPPTSGAIIHIGDVEVAHAINGHVLVHIKRTKNNCVPSGQDLFMRMGDDIGANKIMFKNYSNNEVAAVDSNGNFTSLTNISGASVFSGAKAVSTLRDSDFQTVSGASIANTADIATHYGEVGTISGAHYTHAADSTDPHGSRLVQSTMSGAAIESESISGAEMIVTKDRTVSGAAYVGNIIYNTQSGGITASNYPIGSVLVVYTE